MKPEINPDSLFKIKEPIYKIGDEVTNGRLSGKIITVVNYEVEFGYVIEGETGKWKLSENKLTKI